MRKFIREALLPMCGAMVFSKDLYQGRAAAPLRPDVFWLWDAAEEGRPSCALYQGEPAGPGDLRATPFRPELDASGLPDAQPVLGDATRTASVPGAPPMTARAANEAENPHFLLSFPYLMW